MTNISIIDDISTVIVSDIINSAIITNEDNIPFVIEQIERGPQGITGDQGKSAYQVALDNGFIGTEQEWLDSLSAPVTVLVNRIYLSASRDIGGHRVIISTNTGADYADNLDITHINKVVGISNNSAILGAQVTIITQGEITGFSSLIVGNPIYVGTNGLITQTVPVTGFIQKIGVAITATIALINIQTPIQQI